MAVVRRTAEAAAVEQRHLGSWEEQAVRPARVLVERTVEEAVARVDIHLGPTPLGN